MLTLVLKDQLQVLVLLAPVLVLVGLVLEAPDLDIVGPIPIYLSVHYLRYQHDLKSKQALWIYSSEVTVLPQFEFF